MNRLFVAGETFELFYAPRNYLLESNGLRFFRLSTMYKNTRVWDPSDGVVRLIPYNTPVEVVTGVREDLPVGPELKIGDMVRVRNGTKHLGVRGFIASGQSFKKVVVPETNSVLVLDSDFLQRVNYRIEELP